MRLQEIIWTDGLLEASRKTKVFRQFDSAKYNFVILAFVGELGDEMGEMFRMSQLFNNIFFESFIVRNQVSSKSFTLIENRKA